MQLPKWNRFWKWSKKCPDYYCQEFLSEHKYVNRQKKTRIWPYTLGFIPSVSKLLAQRKLEKCYLSWQSVSIFHRKHRWMSLGPCAPSIRAGFRLIRGLSYSTQPDLVVTKQVTMCPSILLGCLSNLATLALSWAYFSVAVTKFIIQRLKTFIHNSVVFKKR